MKKKKLIIIISGIIIVLLAAFLIFYFIYKDTYRVISVFSIDGKAGVERESKKSDVYESMILSNGDIVDVNAESLLKLMLDFI